MCMLDFCFGVVIGAIITVLVMLFLVWYTTKNVVDDKRT